MMMIKDVSIMKVYSIITDVIEQEIDEKDWENKDDTEIQRLDQTVDEMMAMRENYGKWGKRHYTNPRAAVNAVGGLEFDSELGGIFDNLPRSVDTESMDQYIADHGYNLLIDNYSLQDLMEILPERLQDDIMEWFKDYLWSIAYHEGITLYDKEE